ncbi:hypothetical protein [Streptomyces sp. NRRL S-920]|uniref:hypothetical protein n=1 Tax=Streptomyces sp. NRRL S-920 TaxID=1463921 RepID=UPI000AAD3152|nr:hypothetical protein [Streptomyces sp. NRRL S-920]
MATTQEPQEADPFTATEAVRDALAESGIVFPSLGVDYGSPHLGLVNLGRVRPDVAGRLAGELVQSRRLAAEVTALKAEITALKKELEALRGGQT